MKSKYLFFFLFALTLAFASAATSFAEVDVIEGGGGGGGNPPFVTLSASPTSIASGSSATLTWSSTDATYGCFGGNFSASGESGSLSVSPTVTTTYTVYCDNDWGQGSASATITVTASQPDLTAGSITPTSATVGTAVTLSSTVSNTGSASTGAGFTNLFQRATDASGTGATDIGTFVRSTSSSNSSNFVATLSYSFPSAATWYVRACADKSSAANAGVISESNEGNNCGAWTAVSVGASASVDLTSGTPTLASGSLTTGTVVTFSGSVTNVGGVNTSATFSNRFQIDLSGNGSYDTNLDASNSITALNASQSKAVTSPSWTASAGTHKIRLCADSPTSGVSESDEGNNCGADFTFTVGSATTPTATISASPSSISSGQSSTITWSSSDASSCTGTNFSTSNATSGSVSVSPTTSTTYTVTCTGTGGTVDQSVIVTVSSAAYNTVEYSNKLCSGGTSVGSTAYTSNSCVSYCVGLSASCCSITSTYNEDSGSTSYTCNALQGTQSTVTANPSNNCQWINGEPYNCSYTSRTATIINYGPAVTASLVSNPTSISQGQSALLSWSSTNATSCTGTNFSTGNATSGSVTVNPSTTTTYTLSCTGAGGTVIDTETLTVNVFTVTCSPSPNPVTVYQQVAWTSAATGGTGSYTYSWSGTDSLEGSGSSVNKTYSTIGEKTATLSVTSGSETITAACTGSPCQQTSCTCTGVGCGVVVQEGASSDVSASKPTISGYPFPGGAISFLSSVTNIGNNSISAVFQNRFQVDIGADGSYDVNLNTTGSQGTELVLEFGKSCSTGTLVSTHEAQIYGSGDLDSTIRALCEENSVSGQCCGATVTTGSDSDGDSPGWCKNGLECDGGEANIVKRYSDRSLASAFRFLAITYYNIDINVYSSPTKSNCPSGQTCYAGTWEATSGTLHDIPFGSSQGATSPTWSNIPGGTHRVRMCADSPTSQFLEANENNNCGEDYEFTVSGFDLLGGSTGVNSGTLVAGQQITFFGTVSNSPTTYTASGQCQATVVVTSGNACSLAVSGDGIQWSTSGATIVSSINPLTSSPSVPATGSGGLIITPYEDYYNPPAVAQDLMTNGGLVLYTSGHGFYSGTNVTPNRLCYLIDGPTSYAYSYTQTGFNSPGNNYIYRWEPPIWKKYGASGLNNKLRYTLKCAKPGSPYTLSGSYTFPTPLTEGTHTYELTSNAASPNDTCQATIVIPPLSSGLCTLSASPSIISSGGSSTLTWTATNASLFSINQGIGAVTPTAGGTRSVSPSVTTTYTGTATTDTAIFNYTGGTDTYFEIDLNNDGSFDTTLPVQVPPSELDVNESVQVISPAWTAIVGTHRVRVCIDASGGGEGDVANNCGTPFEFTVLAPTQCADGLDNNSNGLIDLSDENACSSAQDSTEQTLPDADLAIGSLMGQTIVRYNTPASLTWSVTNVDAGSCAITGSNGDSFTLTGSSGTQATSPLTQQTTFTLSCDDLNLDEVSTDAIIRVTPRFEEI